VTGTTDSISLASIQPAFEGVIPATIASCSAGGVPNITYLSIVRRIDSERIALTNQFLTKTASNIRDNPRVLVRVVHPDDMSQYDLHARYLHSVTSGELFESVRVQLDAVAAQTGMTGTFRLRSVDILAVDQCSRVGDVQSAMRTDRERRPLSALGVFVRRLAASGDLAEATRVGCESLDDLFGFGHSMVLLADEATQHLFVVEAHGYDRGRVGAEVAIGEGLIGVAAQRRQTVRVTNMTRTRTLAAAASGGDLHEVPLRGLDDAQSVVAAPMMLQDRLIGVLYLDSSRPGTFDAEAADLVDVIAGHLAVTVALLETGGSEPTERPSTTVDRPPQPPPQADVVARPRQVQFHATDGSLFIEGEYIIRGVPGRILYRLLSEHLTSGRTQFSNKELRLDRTIELPVGNDNLEARLLVLRRRLAERGGVIAIERIGRGRIELRVTGSVELHHQPTHGSASAHRE
jgi:adenylate cyclase